MQKPHSLIYIIEYRHHVFHALKKNWLHVHFTTLMGLVFVAKFRSRFYASYSFCFLAVHMKLTDPAELTRLISRPPKSGGGMRSPTKKSVNNNIGGNHPTSISDGRNSHQSENVQRSGGGREQYIPLTKERIEFLVGLSNKVHKPV